MVACSVSLIALAAPLVLSKVALSLSCSMAS